MSMNWQMSAPIQLPLHHALASMNVHGPCWSPPEPATLRSEDCCHKARWKYCAGRRCSRRYDETPGHRGCGAHAYRDDFISRSFSERADGRSGDVQSCHGVRTRQCRRWVDAVRSHTRSLQQSRSYEINVVSSGMVSLSVCLSMGYLHLRPHPRMTLHRLVSHY